MPTKYPTRTPVASFGNELFSLLIEASRRRVEVPFPTWSLGVRCQQRIHMLRASMQREEHEKYLIVSKVRTSLLWGLKAGLPEAPSRRIKNTIIPVDKLTPAKLILQPQDSEFNEIIRKAGIKVEPLQTLTLDSTPGLSPGNSGRGPSLPPVPSLDDILNSIKDE